MLSEKLLFALVSLLSGASPAGTQSIPDYVYVNMNGGPGLGFFEDSPRIIIGDQVAELNDCSTKNLICAEADGVFIAIPTGSVGIAKDGTKAVVSQRLDASVFGVHVKTNIIDAHRGAVAYRYWYSEEAGLLAFTVTVRGNSAMYLLQQTSGLKAIRKKKTTEPKPID